MEKLRPFPTRINFIRLIADMQVCSTYRAVRKYTQNLQLKSKKKGRVLDVGCGDQPYRFLFKEPYMKDIDYVPMDWDGAEAGFDYQGSGVIHYDGVHFPFGEGEFDLVFHTEVTEHVQDIGFFFKECKRVLHGGGELLFTIPFSARYHYIPYDYWRLTPSAVRLLEAAGFTKIIIEPRGTDITVACYKTLSIGYRWLLSRNIFKMLLAFLLVPLWAVSLLAGQLSIYLGIGETNDCLGYIVYARL